jgi:predicted hotdog family 3-hydroxylacyl-ACP dehydratase
MRLNRAWIESRIPHQGRMCLLDEVVSWSAERIRCRSSTHRAADNPLRAHGRLGIACGMEYAAQTMAVHGALTAGGAPEGLGAPMAGAPAASSRAAGTPAVVPPAAGSPAAGPPAAGYLAAVRGVTFYSSRLDDVPGDLICEAVRKAGDAATALYEFEVRSDAALLMSGRATVILDAGLAVALAAPLLAGSPHE